MRQLLHVLLFVLTFLTTAFAGVQWLNRDPWVISNFTTGIPYAILIMTMLGSHELGHYLAARIHGIDVTLPFFLPFPSFLLLGAFPFGTLGAVIKIQEPVRERKILFDIGAAGPLTGIVVSLAILAIGFHNLPPQEYLFAIHPEYAKMASIPTGGLTFGRSLLFSAFERICAPQGAFLPPMNEIYHYPYLCVGWFGFFVTTLNLLPVGQLDGGHISAALFNFKTKNLIAVCTIVALMVLGSLGFLPVLGVSFEVGWAGWLFWGVILAIFVRRQETRSSNLEVESNLGLGRRIIGWTCLAFFVLTFAPIPFSLQ